MQDFPAILFPHSYLPESILKRVLSLFVPVIIFRPWFMERPILASEADGAKGIQVMYPPETLKPGEDFATTLSEYRQWMEHNQDRGYTEFLQASQGMDLTENTTWEIRQMIRRGGRQASASEKNPALKWHLILHLAQEVEDQRLEADRVLRTLREKDVPLKGIVEESDHVQSLLRDLPPFASEPLGDEYRLRQILEAWFALFGGYLKGNDLLVTFSPHVMGYVTDLWKESEIEDQGKDIASVCFRFPDPSHPSPEHLTEIKEPRFNDHRIRELKGLILDFGKNVAKNLPRLEAWSKEVEASCPWKLSEGSLSLRVKYLAPIPESDQLKMDSVLKHLSNRTIILVEG